MHFIGEEIEAVTHLEAELSLPPTWSRVLQPQENQHDYGHWGMLKITNMDNVCSLQRYIWLRPWKENETALHPEGKIKDGSFSGVCLARVVQRLAREALWA